MAIKLLLGGVVVAAAAIGGGLYAGGVFNSDEEKVEEREPGWQRLSKDNDYKTKITNNTGEYSGKYGEKYGIFLVGLGEENDDWWTWSYNSRYKRSPKRKNKGFEKDITDGETLKAACQKAYKGTLGTDTQEVTEGEVVFRESEIWKFCSSFTRNDLKTLKDMGDEEKYDTKDTYGKNDTHRAVLIATKTKSNRVTDWFWKVKEEELKAEENLSSGTIFKELHDKLKGSGTAGNTVKDTLKETCQEAYEKSEKSDTAKYPKADIGKYCTLSGKALS